jgi:hypothetical protein
VISVAFNAVDPGIEHRLGQTKDYKMVYAASLLLAHTFKEYEPRLVG